MELRQAVLSTEAENGARLSFLLIYVGTEVLRRKVIAQLQTEFGTLSKVLARNKNTLQLHRHGISNLRWSLLFPVIGDPDSKTFDNDIFQFLDAHLLNNSLTLTKTLADIRLEFDDAIKELGTLEHVLSDHKMELNKYLTGAGKPKLLTSEQWDLLFPQVRGPPARSKTATNLCDFDLTLLCFLLRNLCNLPNPSNNNWNKQPAASDVTLSDDIVRLRLFRNKVYGHISSTSLDSQKFNHEWKNLKTILCRLGVSSKEIDHVKSTPLSEDQALKYNQELRRVTESDLADMQTFMMKIVETSQKQREKLSDMHSDLKGAIHEATQVQTEKMLDIHADVKQLIEIQMTDAQPSCSKQRDESGQDRKRNLSTDQESEEEDEPSEKGRRRNTSQEREKDHLEELKENLLEAVKKKYTEKYGLIPRKPWIEGDVIHIDKIFVNLELVEREEFRKSKGCKQSGAAGMGKSTLAQRMCYDWAVREGGICKFECVFLIKAREIKTDIVSHIIQIFMPQEKNNPLLKECITGLLNKESTLIVLDGLDESKTDLEDVTGNTIIHVISNHYPSVQTVVTTRPHSLSLLRSMLLNQFNITGFSKNDVVKYVCLYFSVFSHTLNMESYRRWKYKDDDYAHIYPGYREYDDGEYYPDSESDTFVFIDEQKNIFEFISAIDDKDLWHLVQSPIICLFLTYIWEQLKSLPETKTQVYEALINLFQKIFLQKHTSGHTWKDLINKVGNLALDMLLNEKEGTLIFSKDIVEQYLDAEVACKMGLISAVESVSVSQKTAVDLLESSCQSWYSFLHKSIQEYCAAAYCHNQVLQGKSDSGEFIHKVKSIIQTSEWLKSLDVFLSFIQDLAIQVKTVDTAGYKLMLHAGDVISKEFIIDDILLKSICSRQLDWWKQCGADVDYINVVYTKANGDLYKEYIKYLKSVNKNITAIRDVSSTNLKSFIKPEESFGLYGHYIQKNIRATMTELHHIIYNSKYLTYLCINQKDLSDFNNVLGTSLPDTLQRLILSKCELSSIGVWTVLNNIYRLNQLTLLDLSHNDCIDDITALTCTATTNPTNTLALTEINMSCCHAQEVIIKKVIAMVRQSPGLLKLNLSYNSIGAKVSDLVGALQPPIQDLELACCDITLPCVINIKNLSRLSNLTKVSLGRNSLNDLGGELCDIITPSIEKLELDNCKLTPSAITAVINNLPKWDRLSVLNLSGNCSTDDTVWHEMLSVLPKCTQQTLTILVLDCNINKNLIQQLERCNKNIIIDTFDLIAELKVPDDGTQKN